MTTPNLIMLMAGEGQRFKNGGYSVPKPYIQYMGKSIFMWALSGFQYQSNVFFAIRADHAEYQPEWLRTSNKAVSFNSLTRGALETALITVEKLNLRDEDPVVFADCDIEWRCPGYFQIINSLHRINQKDFAAILYNPIDTKDSKWLYLVGAEKGYLRNYYDIREKDSSRGGYPAIGVYYFSSVEFFKNIAKKIMNNYTENKELYLSTALEAVLLNDSPLFTIPVDSFKSLGVPSDLE